MEIMLRCIRIFMEINMYICYTILDIKYETKLIQRITFVEKQQ